MVGIIRGPLSPVITGQNQIVFASPPRLTQIENIEIDENVNHVQREAPASGYADHSAAPVSVFEYSPYSDWCVFFDPCCESGIRRGLFVRCRARVVALNLY
jgi:hypothetical protein